MPRGGRGKPWSKADDQFLRGHYNTMAAIDLVAKFPGRTEAAIYTRARTLMIQARHGGALPKSVRPALGERLTKLKLFNQQSLRRILEAAGKDPDDDSHFRGL
jgi:hypothetical protein